MSPPQLPEWWPPGRASTRGASRGVRSRTSEAVARGIAEIAITDHVDFDSRSPAYAFADFATRERYVREAAAR